MFNNASLFIICFDQINAALLSIRDFFQSYRPQTGSNVSWNCNLRSVRRSRSHLALNRPSSASSMALARSFRASFSAFHWADVSSGGVWTQTHDNITSSRKSVHKSWNLNSVIYNIMFICTSFIHASLTSHHWWWHSNSCVCPKLWQFINAVDLNHY